MVTPQPARPVAPEDGVRDSLSALLLGIFGLALIIPVVTHTIPSALHPPPGHLGTYAEDLRLLKFLLLLGGLGFLALAVIAYTRGAWLHSKGGLRFVERLPAGTLLALLLVSHVAATAFFFPPAEILSPEPIHTAGHAQQYYRIFASHHLLRENGRAAGYDPFFMAGYPAGMTIDPDTRAAQGFAHVFAFMGLPYATKAYILLVHALLPILIYATARVVRLRRLEAFLATLVALINWHWGRPFEGQLRWNGMHSYLLACTLAVFAVGLLTRFFAVQHRARFAAYAGFVVAMIAVGFLQPAAWLVITAPLLLLYVRGFRDLRRRDHVALAVAVGLMALVHTWTLVPMFKQRGLLLPPSLGLQLGGWRDLAAVVVRPTSLPVSGLVVLALCGARALWRHNVLAALGVFSTAFFAWGLAALGAEVHGLRRLETARFLFPGILALAFPAALALRAVLERLQRLFGPVLVPLVLVAALGLPPLAALLDTHFYYAHRLDATLDERFKQLMARVEEVAPREARVLFESSDVGWISRQPRDAFLQALVPVFTKRETIGGPNVFQPSMHARVDFGAGKLVDRPFIEWTADEFTAFLGRYNVGAVVVWSTEARRFVAGQALATYSVEELDGVDIYVVRAPPQPLVTGIARLRVGYDRLELSQVQGEELVLKYHWVEGLHSTPLVPVERAVIDDDPVGFIRVRPQGQTRLVLRTHR